MLSTCDVDFSSKDLDDFCDGLKFSVGIVQYHYGSNFTAHDSIQNFTIFEQQKVATYKNDKACENSWKESEERRTQVEGPAQAVYSEDELDSLAILFAVVKILYLCGALQHAASLASLIEPTCRASMTPLHHTKVRNEAAYFGCVHQVCS